MISCLCVTHERPEFMPWVEHQFLKQSSQTGSYDRLIIVDSSAVPWEATIPDVKVLHHPEFPGIAAKRTMALAWAGDSEYITWFDDDDWQDPDKLMWHPNYDAVGARHAYMYSTMTGKAALYESTYEPIIFNSGVYRKSSVPQTFDARLTTGEDTEWHERWLKTRPSYVTLGEPMHAWLCHGKNITNRANARSFELVNQIPFDDWEREFLARFVQ